LRIVVTRFRAAQRSFSRFLRVGDGFRVVVDVVGVAAADTDVMDHDA
jgi:hypothetical protein